MYRRILLATDSSAEGLTALREGALLARALNAEARLLIVEAPPVNSSWTGEDLLPGGDPDQTKRLLERGLSRLRSLGLTTSGGIVLGEPVAVITAEASVFHPDLIVVGHRRKSFIERWWSGNSGARLSDHVSCSVLVARIAVSDEEFDAAQLHHAT